MTQRLNDLAVVMASVAKVDEIARKHLSGGLSLTLLHHEGDWTLSLTRPNTWPSVQEEKTCRESFQVPGGARRQTLVRQTEKAGQTIQWFIVRYHWGVSLNQLALDIHAPGKDSYYTHG